MPASYWFEDRRAPKKYYEYDEGWRNRKLISAEEFYSKKKDGDSRLIEEWTKTDLIRVDVLVCKFMNDPSPHPTWDSQPFTFLHQMGFSSLVNLGGSYVEELHVDWIVKKYRENAARMPEELDPVKAEDNTIELDRLEALVRWAFLVKWRFGACG